MNRDRIKKEIAGLPQEPGVYFFKDSKGGVLYVGKATSLRDRVKSYFSKDLEYTRGHLIARMVGEVCDISFERTGSTLEALILEANWIKKLRPPYNTMQKDDKSYNYVVITKEEYPIVMTVRGQDLKMRETDLPVHARARGLSSKTKFVFGPYPHGAQLREALKIVRRIFPYRDEKCKAYNSEAKDAKHGSSKPCFNRQIGLCPGTCTGEVSKAEYARTIRHIVLFFEGKKNALLKQLEKEMKVMAKVLEFEKAEAAKRQIFALNHIRDVSLIKEEPKPRREGTVRLEAYDIAHISGTHVVGVMVVVEDGYAKKSDYRKFRIRWKPGVDDSGALKEVLVRRFGHPEWPRPTMVLVDGGVAQFNAAKAVLSTDSLDIPVIAVTKNERHRPESFIGDERLVYGHKKEILLANSEAHRFAVAYHRLLRGKLKRT